jgi:DNA (cytosine-5)-methyltransferase 1
VGATVAVPRDGWGGDESGGGVAAGPRAVAAWRLLDAQWFGVPQRRLRVFVLGARAGGCDPAQVLLEPEGVYRNPPTRGETRERAAAGAAFGALGPSSVADPISASEGKTYTHEGENNFRLHNVVSFQPNAGKNAHGQAIFENVTPTIGGAGGGNMPAVLAFDTHVQATAGTPRRLMPIECERLMSWPDDFTNVPDEKGKPASDSVRYKAIGNGVVSNVAEWIARRLIAVHDAMGEP